MIATDLAVVGGGFSGAMAVANVARADAGVSLRVFEPGELGRGAAYATPCAAHLLNTRAQAMSAFPDDPDHFVRWLNGRAAPTAFVPRRWYGDYVAGIARDALRSTDAEYVRERVVALRRRADDFELVTASGERACARAVILATGNASPEALPPELTAAPGYIGDPWRFDFRNVGGHVLVVGSGLTALDVLVALAAAGHRGVVWVVSRGGRFPEVHAEGLPPLDVTPVLDATSARSALRTFRRRVGEAQARGYDWRTVVDALRPETETLWRRLPQSDRRRFDRHLRRRWERHRHRAPGEVAAAAERYRESGRLTVLTGRVAGGGSGVVTIDTPEGRVGLRPDWIVNCTGPGRNAHIFGEPLLAGVLRDGLVTPEPLGLGLRVDAGLRSIGSDGTPVEGLWAIGPLARGTRFEATAVPELRTMARDAAGRALDLLKKANPSGRRLLDAEAIL